MFLLPFCCLPGQHDNELAPSKPQLAIRRKASRRQCLTRRTDTRTAQSGWYVIWLWLSKVGTQHGVQVNGTMDPRVQFFRLFRQKQLLVTRCADFGA